VIISCESEDCLDSTEVSDPINKDMEEVLQIIKELEDKGWGVLQDPANIYCFCPEHKSLAIAGQALLDALNRPERE